MHTTTFGGPEVLPCKPPPPTTELVLLPRLEDRGRAVFSTNTGAVRKILQRDGVAVRELEVEGEPLYRDERGLTWLGPVIFIAAAAYTSNPHIISVTLNIISNYLTDIFRGSTKDVDVKLEVVVEVEPERLYHRVAYEGPVAGLKELAPVVEAAMGNKERQERQEQP